MVSWVKTDDLLPHHRKIMAAGPKALTVLGLYQAGNAFCQRHFTDGMIRRADLPLLCPAVPHPAAALLALMVSVGLWEPLASGNGDGWQVHDWLDYNEAAEVRRARLAAESARKRLERPARFRPEADKTPPGGKPASVSSSSPLLSAPLRRRGLKTKTEGQEGGGPGEEAPASADAAAPPIAAALGFAPWPSPEALVAMYNAETPPECPEVTRLSPARRIKARRYLDAFPDAAFWHKVFARIHESRFLRGLAPPRGERPFVADFDWLLTKGKDGSENAMKTFDGKYTD